MSELRNLFLLIPIFLFLRILVTKISYDVAISDFTRFFNSVFELWNSKSPKKKSFFVEYHFCRYFHFHVTTVILETQREYIDK